ncbi:Slp family lipoprotein [Sodalis endosymbiont of Spalangia cameroni]|uniref:Slp family lipoprotein n=1 Tax=Sodalis praecaptivus TaxID=1239307 RepID=UPI0031F96A59
MSSHQASPVSLRRLMPVGFLAAMLTLTGCVTVPEAIRGTTPTPQDDLVRVMNAPQLYIGQEGRFGGKVVKVTNETGRTRLEIATVPLDDGAVPLMHQPSLGRIIAQISGFVEPSDLKGQWVTVVGPITGTEKGHIDKANYTYMVMQVNGYKRWRIVREVSAPMGPPLGPWGWDYRYGSPWGPGYGPAWGAYYGDTRVDTVLVD